MHKDTVVVNLSIEGATNFVSSDWSIDSSTNTKRFCCDSPLYFPAQTAYETRNVKIEALNDSKNIGMSVYNVFILSCTGAVFSLLMDPLRNETVFIVTSVCITVSTTTTLLIIFTPKVSENQMGDVIGHHL